MPTVAQLMAHRPSAEEQWHVVDLAQLMRGHLSLKLSEMVASVIKVNFEPCRFFPPHRFLPVQRQDIHIVINLIVDPIVQE